MGASHPTARGPRTVHKDFDMLNGPTIEQIDVEDLRQTAMVAEHQVQVDLVEKARMSVLQDAIAICYKQHGPNHAVRCRPIYIEYLRRLEDTNGVRINIEELHPKEKPEGEEEGHAEINSYGRGY